MTTTLACSCGKVRLAVRGKPIFTTECHCNSCREAGARIGALDGAPRFLADNGGTPFVIYRKDRVEIVEGMQHLKAFRLTAKSSTRRILATCCNAPVFLEFRGGHWLSIYSNVWPEGTMPPIELRTMTGDLENPDVLTGDIPNSRSQSLGFFARLLGSWIAMGFRSPRVEVNGEI